MTLYERLENDMKTALKEGNATRLSVIRMLISDIKMSCINKKIDTAPEADIMQILRKQIKQRKDSIEQFTSGNRKDLADKELGELKILETYMPQQLGEAELEALVKTVMTEVGATTRADMGKVMKVVMEKSKGACDGKMVNQLVMKHLK